MSQANVELMRMLFERWNAGDHLAPLEHLDPEAELESPLSSVAGEPYRGVAGFNQWMHDLDDQFAEWRLTIDAARDLGNTVLAVGSIHLRGRASGIAFDQPAAWLADFGADHRFKRVRIFVDIDAAFAAAGVSRDG